MILVDEKWKDIVIKGTSRSSVSFMLEMESYKQRENFRRGVSWHIPNTDIIETLKSISPVVSVGSGFGYTESIALKEGVDIISTDINPNMDNHWCRGGIFFGDVQKIDAIDAIKKYADRNVFMAWPAYNNSMAADVAENMKSGTYLLYVGESEGGCTGDERFFHILENDFVLIEENFIPRWEGIRDTATLYKKITKNKKYLNI